MKKNKITFLILLVLLLSTLSTAITYARIPPGQEDNVEDKDKAMIIVGDSRVMHMDYLVSDKKAKKNTYLIHHNGGNINCISSPSYSSVATWLPKALNKYPNAPVTLWLGENGASWTKEKNFKKNYDMIIKKYPTHTFFVMTVGPDGSATGSYSNKNVLKVNKVITKRYLTDASKTQDEIGSDNFEFYDMYSYMVNDLGLDIPKNGKDANGKGYAKDLTHYTSGTSKKVIKQMIKVMEGKVSASTTGPNDSSDDQDGDNDDSGSGGDSGDSGGSGYGQLKDFDLIKGENELKDMPKPSKLTDSREDIDKIANENQVSTTDYMSSDYIKEGIETQKENRRIRITRVIFLFAALCLIEYSVLLLLAYLFDIASIFGSLSLLNVVTFGRVHYAAAPTDAITNEMKSKYKVMTFKQLLLDMAILNIVAAVMIEGSIFYWVYRLIIFGRSLF